MLRRLSRVGSHGGCFPPRSRRWSLSLPPSPAIAIASVAIVALWSRRFLEERTRLRDVCERYLPHEVVGELLSGHPATDRGGECRCVAVLFCDLRGYSSIAEKLGPSVLMALMNEYFEAMAGPVEEAGGTVLEYRGDGMLAVFGAPVERADAASRALRCASEIRDRLERLNEVRAGSLQVVLPFGIGLHFGEVVAGNLGSSHLVKYGVVGDVVNVAARIQELTRDLEVSVLVSDELRCHLPAEVAGELLFVGDFPVRGREGVVRLHVLG